jgi:hypothetical protein
VVVDFHQYLLNYFWSGHDWSLERTQPQNSLYVLEVQKSLAEISLISGQQLGVFLYKSAFGLLDVPDFQTDIQIVLQL